MTADKALTKEEFVKEWSKVYTHEEGFTIEQRRQDHATVIHAKKTIVNDTTTRPDFNMKVKAYLHYLRRVIVSDDANEISRQLKEREIFDKFMDVLDKMELVARVYCELTNKQIINVK
jgi:hypothetical protein